MIGNLKGDGNFWRPPRHVIFFHMRGFEFHLYATIPSTQVIRCLSVAACMHLDPEWILYI